MKRQSAKQKARQNRIALQRIYNKRLRKLSKSNRQELVATALSRRIRFARENGVGLDRNLARHQLILPETLSFRENFAETSATIDVIRAKALNENTPVFIHFDRVRLLEPAAALVLVAEVYRCQKLRVFRSGRFISGNYPVDAAVHEQLRGMGFFKLLGIAENVSQLTENGNIGQPIFLKFVTGTRVENEFIDRFVSVVENHIVQLSEIARARLVGAIIEAMGNTLDHANKAITQYQSMQQRWWLSASVNVEQHEVAILLFDQGVGIPRTLDANAYEKINAALVNLFNIRISANPTDGSKIRAATELHRSGTGQPGRGKGFRTMKTFVDACNDGELRVLSNRGCYHYMPQSEMHDDESTSIGGTLIEWRFRSGELVDIDDE